MQRIGHVQSRMAGTRLHPWRTGMTVALLALGLALLAGTMRGALQPAAAPLSAAAQRPALADIAAPGPKFLHFEPNRGQAPKAVRYLSRGPLHSVQVFDDGMHLSARPAAADAAPPSAYLRFIGANREGRFESREPAPGKASYLRGSDPAQWIRDLPRYRQLRYAQLYAGIDLVYYSRDGEMEFDFVVKPGADPSRIRFHVDALVPPVVADSGELLLDGAQGALRLRRPVLYQHIDGQKKVLAGRYVLRGEREVGFEVADYDKRHPLIIDPVFNLLHSTYLGGVHDDVVGGMVLDANGNAYVVGHSGSEDWPVSGNAVQTDRKNLGVYVRNVVVTKFDAAGTLVWSTFLGGSVNDYGRGIALDAAGRVLIAGQTLSSDFPTTANALQRQLQGSGNAFIAVLSADGSALEYSSLYGGIGGSDATGLRIDAASQVVIAGSAGPGLATTAGAYQATLADGNAAFVAKFDLPVNGAAALKAASYYGAALRPSGQNNDNLSYAFALDASGAPWLTGQAFTRSLPVTADAAMAAPATLTASCQAGSVPLNSAAYVAKLSADLKTLVYASYLTGRTGGPSTCAEFGRGIALDGAGSVYVAGSTASLAFPTTPGALQATSPANAGTTGYAGFVLKLAADGRSLAWSTYLGGNGGNMFFSGITADSASNAVWVAGTTGGGSNFPLSADGQQRVFGGGSYDASYHQLDAATGALKYGSYLGGTGNEDALALAIDGGGTAYIAGNTDSRNLTVTANAFQPAYTANAYDGNDWFFRILGSGTIGSVSPRSGGAGGDVTVRVNGSGFQQGATAKLVSAGGEIAARSHLVSADGSSALLGFSLEGVATGVYDLHMSNPDGTQFARKSAFTVDASGLPELSAQIIGRPKIRTGVEAAFTVNVTNSGSQDALLIPLWITLPSNVQFRLYNQTRERSAEMSTTDGPVTYISLLLQRLAPGETVAIPLALTTTADVEQLPISAALQRPWFRTLAQAQDALSTASFSPGCIPDPLNAAYANCYGTYQQYAIAGQRALETSTTMQVANAARKRPLGSPICEAQQHAKESLENGKRDGRTDLSNGKGPGDAGSAFLQNVPHPAKDPIGWINYNAGYYSGQIDVITGGGGSTGGGGGGSSCNDPLPNPPPTFPSQTNAQTTSGGSIDPNDKFGPNGDGSSAHFVSRPTPISYQVAFENLPTAALSAAEVVVTDQLDATKYDLSTLKLGSISWGSHRIYVPPGLNNYSTIYNIDATMSVRVAGSLNPTTGVLKWTFTTIDPLTKLPPSDPTLGFLPPNVNGTQGQGYVNFTISPKAGLPDDTRWENAASIVFDTNAPIVTPTWVNTLDTTAPVGRVVSATQRSGSTEVDVNWSATDSGSGARSYTVYVAANGGAFTAWQTAVTATSAVWAGTAGHTYGFYVVATDGAGNSESAKTVAEASVTLPGDPAVPGDGDGEGGGDAGGCTVGGPNQRDISLPLLSLLAVAVLACRRRYRAIKAPAV
jgi:hypothetical protein